MNCGDINELAPLWRSGEMNGEQRAGFDAHLAACPDCAGEMREQSAEDVRLREAMVESARESSAARAVEQRIMRQIARERFQRRLIAGTAIAAAVVAAAVLLTAPRRAPVNPPVFADAARDHTVEVIERSPRHWRTEPGEIASIEASQGISEADVKALEAIGYQLQRAKICRLGSTLYMHMVYAKGGREFSLYLRARGAQPPADAASSAGNLQLASFARGRVQAVIVTDAPRAECAQFARAAEDAL